MQADLRCPLTGSPATLPLVHLLQQHWLPSCILTLCISPPQRLCSSYFLNPKEFPDIHGSLPPVPVPEKEALSPSWCPRAHPSPPALPTSYCCPFEHVSPSNVHIYPSGRRESWEWGICFLHYCIPSASKCLAHMGTQKLFAGWTSLTISEITCPSVSLSQPQWQNGNQGEAEGRAHIKAKKSKRAGSMWAMAQRSVCLQRRVQMVSRGVERTKGRGRSPAREEAWARLWAH